MTPPHTEHKTGEAGDGLRACPFCQEAHALGVRAISGLFMRNGVMFNPMAVCCDMCNARGPYEDSRDKAIAAWNWRSPQ